MKKLMATLTLCALPLFGFAGPHCPAEGKMMDQAIEKLDLSADQKKQLANLKEKHKSERDAEMKKMEEMHDKHHADLKAVLGEEKFKKFEELMKSEHGKGGMKHHHMDKTDAADTKAE